MTYKPTPFYFLNTTAEEAFTPEEIGCSLDRLQAAVLGANANACPRRQCHCVWLLRKDWRKQAAMCVAAEKNGYGVEKIAFIRQLLLKQN